MKAGLYAHSGFPEYWVVDLRSDEVVVHRGPRPDGTWREVTRHGRDETLAVPTFDDLTIALSQVIPPR